MTGFSKKSHNISCELQPDADVAINWQKRARHRCGGSPLDPYLRVHPYVSIVSPVAALRLARLRSGRSRGVRTLFIRSPIHAPWCCRSSRGSGGWREQSSTAQELVWPRRPTARSLATTGRQPVVWRLRKAAVVRDRRREPILTPRTVRRGDRCFARRAAPPPRFCSPAVIEKITLKAVFSHSLHAGYPVLPAHISDAHSHGVGRVHGKAAPGSLDSRKSRPPRVLPTRVCAG